ncbi:hypothetical protein TPA0910_11720 [Streptomyces hygroscopicus subsp. sporocinereus]|uniref:Uncharacterized protein n=1 Tax=Streptomyces hygroscopicus TaxID=1912 RepID=A0ABQ3TTU9_STRHY|nr:hypothetical protein TPA0910_11720 [Streptomyces hygroscopicus]
MRPSEAKRGRVPPGCSPAALRACATRAALPHPFPWKQDTPGVPGVAEAGDTFGAAVASEDWNTGGVPDVMVGPRGRGEAMLAHITHGIACPNAEAIRWRRPAVLLPAPGLQALAC